MVWTPPLKVYTAQSNPLHAGNALADGAWYRDQQQGIWPEGFVSIMKTALSHVAFVDDEPELRALAELALAVVGGLRVTLCASGVEALRTIPTCRPQMVLMDASMPGLDGLATLTALRAMPATATTPVVFITATNDPDHVASLKRAGALDVLAKPFDLMTLCARLREIWADRPRITSPAG